MFKKIFFLFVISTICLYSTAEATRDGDVINKIIQARGSVKVGFIPSVKANGMEEKASALIDKLEEEMLKGTSQGKYGGDKVIVVERNHLNKIMEEQRLIASGLTTSETIKIGRLAGLDIIYLAIVYSESINLKVLAVETGEILATKSYNPKASKVLENSSFSVPPGRYIEHHWNIEAGTVLNISVRSNSDVNAWLLDDTNYSQFPKGKWGYFAEASGQRIYNADFVFTVPATGNYYYILDNRFSVISSKGVALTVTVAEP